jgi:hypothetical protein
MYGRKGLRFNAVAPGPTITNIQARFGSQLAAERLGPLMGVNIPAPATAAQLAASITFLLSDDGTNVNGVVLASDGVLVGHLAASTAGQLPGGKTRLAVLFSPLVFGEYLGKSFQICLGGPGLGLLDQRIRDLPEYSTQTRISVYPLGEPCPAPFGLSRECHRKLQVALNAP